MMMMGVKEIGWDDYSEAIPAFLAMMIMPLDLNISAGISAGFLTYVLLKVCPGQARELHWLTYVCGVLGLIYFAFLHTG